MITVAAYGAGLDSTAMIALLTDQGVQIDLILFADTGGERPSTYAYLQYFSKWLIDHGQPQIIIVKKGGKQETLEENCLRMNMLPSIAYGYKTCSQKYKIQPQNKFVNNWAPARKAWKAGQRVVKYIGYDADESHRATISDDKKYEFRYPLIENNMGRDECTEFLQEHGICPPGKSACFFCPSSKVHEIFQLARDYPELSKRALAMEANAHLTAVKGLGRRFAWRDVLTQQEFKATDFGTPEAPCGCYDG